MKTILNISTILFFFMIASCVGYPIVWDSYGDSAPPVYIDQRNIYRTEEVIQPNTVVIQEREEYNPAPIRRNANASAPVIRTPEKKLGNNVNPPAPVMRAPEKKPENKGK